MIYQFLKQNELCCYLLVQGEVFILFPIDKVRLCFMFLPARSTQDRWVQNHVDSLIFLHLNTCSFLPSDLIAITLNPIASIGGKFCTLQKTFFCSSLSWCKRLLTYRVYINFIGTMKPTEIHDRTGHTDRYNRDVARLRD